MIAHENTNPSTVDRAVEGFAYMERRKMKKSLAL